MSLLVIHVLASTRADYVLTVSELARKSYVEVRVPLDKINVRPDVG